MLYIIYAILSCVSFSKLVDGCKRCHSSGAQIPFELGLVIERPLGYFVLPLTVVEVFQHIKETNFCALIISVISIAFLVTIKVSHIAAVSHH